MKSIKRKSNNEKKTFPRVAYLFHAVVAFKRLISTRRKWKLRNARVQLNASSTALKAAIQKSHNSVKHASFGRAVITAHINNIRKGNILNSSRSINRSGIVAQFHYYYYILKLI
jgi:hypothetical protein